MGKVSGGAGRGTGGAGLRIRRAAGVAAGDEVLSNNAMMSARGVEWFNDPQIRQGDTLTVRLSDGQRRLTLLQNGRMVGRGEYFTPYDLNDVGLWARRQGVNLRWASTANRNRSRYPTGTLQAALTGTMYR